MRLLSDRRSPWLRMAARYQLAEEPAMHLIETRQMGAMYRREARTACAADIGCVRRTRLWVLSAGSGPSVS